MREIYFRFKEGSTEVMGTTIKATLDEGMVTGLQDITTRDRELTFSHIKENSYQITSPKGRYSAQPLCPPLFVETAPRVTYQIDFNPEQPRVLGSSDGRQGFLEVVSKEQAEKMVEDATNFNLMRAWVC
ncbi:MAG: hypothetical protein AABX95_01815 [Nanoarchaeota archaeon]